MLEDISYQTADIVGKESNVKTKLGTFVDSIKGESESVQRINLPKIKKELHMAVDSVMDDLPNGVERVDGSVIQPILNEVVNEKIAKLPVIKGAEE